MPAARDCKALEPLIQLADEALVHNALMSAFDPFNTAQWVVCLSQQRPLQKWNMKCTM